MQKNEMSTGVRMLRPMLALTALAATTPAFADTHITFVDEKGATASQMYVKGDKVRMDMGGNGQGYAIYDVASNSLKVMMPAQKKYMVFDQQSAAQMGAVANGAQQQAQAASAQAQGQMAQHQAEMDDANKKLEASMANMTPEQKAMVEKMMAAQSARTGSALSAAQNGGGVQVDMKELGTSETVAGHSCKDVQMMVNGKPSASMCIVDSPASLGIPAADLKTLEAMRDGMQKIVSQIGPMGQGMSSMMARGFAIKTTRQTYQNFKPVTETDSLKSVSTSSVDAGLFTLPSGYTQTSMQEMMQGGHQ